LNAQTAAQTLSEFGIEANTALREWAAYGEDIDTSDFTMAIHNWGGAYTSSHPHAFFSTIFSDNRAAVGNFDPTAMEVPMPVGDPAGSVKTLDAREKIATLAKADGDAQDRLIRELAWIYNQALPRLPLMTGIKRRWLATDRWEYPSIDSQWMRDNPVINVLSTGRLSPTNEGEETTFTVPTHYANPSDVQWNPYFAQAARPRLFQLLFEAPYVTGAGPNGVDRSTLPERTPLLGKRVQIRDGTLTLEIKHDRTWTDGDPVTAEDLAVKYRLEQHLGFDSGDFWDSLDVTDTYTIAFDIGDRNPDLVTSVLLPQNIETKRESQYGAWVESFASATTEAERESIREDVVGTTIDTLHSHGLWKLDSASSTRFLLRKHEGHPLAEDLPVDAVEMPALSQNQKRWQSFKSGRVDALFFATAPKSMEQRFPDHAHRLAFDQRIGDGIVFNHGRKPFDDWRVRQAIAFLINRWRNTHNAKDFVTTIEWPVGLTNDVAREYLAEDLSDYQRYGYEKSHPDPARRLLEAAGYIRR
jgi:ABC-type transport system substrate-binding protein